MSRRSWARNGSDGRARLLRDHLDLLVDGAVAGLHAPEGPSAALPGIVGEVFWCAALCGEDGSLLWMLTDVVDACVGAANRGAASGGGPGHAAGTLRVFRTIIRSIGGPRKVTEEGGAGKRDGGDHLAYGKPWIAMLSEELSNGVTRHDAADDEDDDPCDPEEYFIDHYKKRRDDDDADDADEPAEKPAGDDRRKTSQCIWWRWTRWTRAAPSSPRGGADVRRRPAPRGLPPPRRAAAALPPADPLLPAAPPPSRCPGATAALLRALLSSTAGLCKLALEIVAGRFASNVYPALAPVLGDAAAHRRHAGGRRGGGGVCPRLRAASVCDVQCAPGGPGCVSRGARAAVPRGGGGGGGGGRGALVALGARGGGRRRVMA